MTLITINKSIPVSRYFVILCYAHYKGHHSNQGGSNKRSSQYKIKY